MEHHNVVKRIRVGVAVPVLALVVASCSGGSSEEAAGPAEWTSVAELDPDEVTGPIAEIADALTTDFGSAPAAGAALIAAAARGYHGEQILAGVAADGLQTNGTIVIDGELIEPIDEPGYFVTIPARVLERSTPNPDLHGIRVAQQADDPMEWFEKLQGIVEGSDGPERDAGRATLMVIVGLLRSGYSAEQILSLVFSANFNVEGFLIQGCAVVVDPDGDGPVLRVKGGEFETALPDHAPQPECVDAASKQEVEPDSTTAAGTEASTDSPAASEGGVGDGTYTGSIDTSVGGLDGFIESSQWLVDSNTASMEVTDGAVVTFRAAISGVGASNVNVASGERLCENDLEIVAELLDPSIVEMSDTQASFEVEYALRQGEGSGSACFDDSGAASEQVTRLQLTVDFTADGAIATAGTDLSIPMTR